MNENNKTKIRVLDWKRKSLWNPEKAVRYIGTIEKVTQEGDKYRISFCDGVFLFVAKYGVENNVLKIGGKIEITVVSNSKGSRIVSTIIIE